MDRGETSIGGPHGGASQLRGAVEGASVSEPSEDYVDKLNARYRSTSAALSDGVTSRMLRRNLLLGILIAAAVLLVVVIALRLLPD